MTYLAIFSLIILIAYCLLIGYYIYTLDTLSTFRDFKDELNIKVSVIIIGRNEEQNIEKCLRSIQQNNYKQKNFEIIYVDDHSDDNSIEEIIRLKIKNLKLLELEDYADNKVVNSFKKEGIAYALKHAIGELILHTDADTVVGKDWIRNHANAFYFTKAKFIAAPVFIKANNSFLEQFQYLDFISTMGITAAGNQSSLHFMANGANMSYPISLLKDINLESTSNYASGDDMFLVHEVGRKDPETVFYLLNEGSEVITSAETSWKDFFGQRIRWAGKSNAYTDRNLRLLTRLVFISNLLSLVLFIISIVSGKFMLFLTYFGIKSFMDIFFLKRSANMFKKQIYYIWIFPSLCFYPIYYVLVGLSAIIIRKYWWKGRKVR